MNTLLPGFVFMLLKSNTKACARKCGCLLVLLALLHWPFAAISQYNPGVAERVEISGDPVDEYEETTVVLQVQLVGSSEVPAIIRGQVAYLAVKDIFAFLKIKAQASDDAEVLEGFFIDPKATYLIDKKHNQIKYQDKVFDLGASGLMATETNLFLRADLFGEVFGLDCRFNFRSLSVALNTRLELPVIREKQREKMRQNVMQLRGEKKADTTLTRSFSLLHMGVADWSVWQTKTLNGRSDTRFNLSLGAMIAGGEATAYLAYRPGNSLRNQQQLYRWRYVDNDRSLIRQLVLGNLSTKTISSVFGPVTGVQVSNTPTTFRRSFGTYRLSNTTQPGWLVELYVNNVLIDYTRADASGFFTFDVPLVYGNSAIKLRFFGPWGEEETKEENLVIPFNFLPARQLEYNLTAGIVKDGLNSRLSRIDVNYGLHRSITVGGGMEYLSSGNGGKAFPFVNAAMRLGQQVLLSGEHSHGVRSTVNIRSQLPANMQVEANYVRYAAGQTALRPGRETLLNYQHEKKAMLFIPIRSRKVMAFSRLSFNQLGLADFKLTTGEMLLSGQYAGVNTNFTTAFSYSGPADALLFSNLAMTFRLLKGTRVTPQLRYEYTRQGFNLARVELERNVLRNGFFNFSYGRNIAQQTNNLTVGFRYNFSFAQASTFAARMDRSTTLVQAVRGSLLYNEYAKRLQVSNQPAIGRGGLLIVAFLDLNDNGRRDPGEPNAPGLKLRVNGGRMQRNTKDGSIRVSGLEAYASYFVEVDKNSFDEITWQIKKPTIKVTAEPNHFKLIEVPVSVSGEVSGMVYLGGQKGVKGLGGILVNIFNKEAVLVTQVLTTSDGYFSYLGLGPGAYTARIDTAQLQTLKMASLQDSIAFNIRRSAQEGDFVDGLQFVLQNDEPAASLLAANNSATSDTTAALTQTLPDSSKLAVAGSAQPKDSTTTAPAVGTRRSTPETAGSKQDHVGKPDRHYIVVGAYSSMQAAQAVKEQLLRQNIKARIIPPGRNSRLYQVSVADFGHRTEAQQALAGLKKRFGKGAWILRHPEVEDAAMIAVADSGSSDKATPAGNRQADADTSAAHAATSVAGVGAIARPIGSKSDQAETAANTNPGRKNTWRKLLAKVGLSPAISVQESYIDITQSDHYFVVTGSYTSLGRARRAQRELARSGINAKIILPYPGAKYYRVAVADIAQKETALQALPQLRKQFGQASWLLHFDKDEANSMLAVDAGPDAQPQARSKRSWNDIFNSQPATSAGAQESDVDAAQPAHYFVGSNAYASLNKARKAQRELARRNINSQVVLPFAGSRYFRVALADLNQKEEALQVLTQVRKQFGDDSWMLHLDKGKARQLLPFQTGKHASKTSMAGTHTPKEVDKKDAAASGQNHRFVVAGNYASLHRAQRVKRELALIKISSEVIPPSIGVGYYRVVVSDPAHKEKAYKVLLQLQKQFGGTIQVGND